MRRSFVQKPRSFDQFGRKIPGKYFTPVANRRLDEIYRNKVRPVEDRFDALLLRTSWGNFSDFACDRVEKSQSTKHPEPTRERTIIKALVQADFARMLDVDPRRIQELVKLRQDQGLMARREDLENPGLLVPLYEPVAPLSREEQSLSPRGAVWKSFIPLWAERYPEDAEILTRAEEIKRRRMAIFKGFLQSGLPEAAEPGPMQEAPRGPGPKYRDSPDENTASPRNPKTANPHTSNGLEKTGGRQTLNIKEESTPQVRNSSVFKTKNPSSVGRSAVTQEAPTDRPTGESASEENPWKDEIREWLESRFKLPTPIEDPELGQIAATIQSAVHFEQFKAAAERSKKPKGWRYFVAVALDCQKHQEKYSTASAGGKPAEESAFVRMYQQTLEEEAARPKKGKP